jgi:hypothetical protein
VSITFTFRRAELPGASMRQDFVGSPGSDRPHHRP